MIWDQMIVLAGSNLASFIDDIMPGKYTAEIMIPKDFSVRSAISTALLGLFSGEFLLSDRLKKTNIQKNHLYVRCSSYINFNRVILGFILPINKNLWSSHLCASGRSEPSVLCDLLSYL
jgi:hypothetical protein